MKRHPALECLSRDHHRALVVARHLRYVEPDTAQAARDAFVEYWLTAGERHFRIEEEVLLPALASSAVVADPVVARVLHDHAEIRFQALAMQSGMLAPAVQRELGELLGAHVRLEERALFPLIEATLNPQALTDLARALDEAEG